MKKLAAVALLAALAACGPSDMVACKNEAAKMPTPQGVTLAAIQCEQQFGTPPWESWATTPPAAK